ncbi:MAG: TrmB family transcriptional regulator [Candidatus Bathyarchaeia archaeon]|jgi:sugar-specific transcriptional regulator TrmB
MAEDESIQILTKLGFTASQAKVYLTLVKLDKSKVSTIAKIAHLDRAETYRSITQLEEKGFLLKILTNPVEYKATPLKELLQILFNKQKSEVIQIQKDATRIFEHSIGHREILQQEECTFCVPRAEMAYHTMEKEMKKVERSVKNLTSERLLQEYGLPLFREKFANAYLDALKRGVKITVLLYKPSNEKNILALAKELTQLTQYQNFILKVLPYSEGVLLSIRDDKRVWICTSNERPGESSRIVSNNPHIVELAKSYFERALETANVGNM